MAVSESNRRIRVVFPNGERSEITEGVHADSVTLERILTDDSTLKFGLCNSAKFGITVANISDVAGLNIKVYADYDETSKLLFTGKIDSSKLSTNRLSRQIIAYDAMYEKASVDVSKWYNSLFSSKLVTLKTMRESLLTYVGLSSESTTLPNDGIYVSKSINSKSLRFDDVMQAICELNGCYGQINAEGKFKYVTIGATTEDISSNYRQGESSYEEFTTKKYNKVQIFNDSDILIGSSGSGANAYVLDNNFLAWGMSAVMAQQASSALYVTIKDIAYRPCNVKLILADLDLKLGAKIILGTGIESYVLKLSLSGSQLFKETLTANGTAEETGAEKTSSEIQGIKNKLNNINNYSNYRVQIYATNDIAIAPTTLTAKIIDGNGEDCTSDFPESIFRWKRQSENADADENFNKLNLKGHEIEIEEDTGLGPITYICDVDLSTNGDMEGEITVNSVDSNTYYNMVFDDTTQKYMGGTDIYDNSYALKSSSDLASTAWENTGMYDREAAIGQKCYVVSGDDRGLAYAKGGKAVRYWDKNSNSETETDGYNVHYSFDSGYFYRLYYTINEETEEKTYYLTKSLYPNMAQSTVILTTSTPLKQHVVSTSVLVVGEDNKIYKVDNSELTLVYDDMALTGIVKISACQGHVIAISEKGLVAHAYSTDLTEWNVTKAGTEDLVDVYADTNAFYIINTSGKVYSGTSTFKVHDIMGANPLSINLCGLYLVSTYAESYMYKMYEEKLALKLVREDIGYNIAVLRYWNGYYWFVHQADGTSYREGTLYKTDNLESGTVQHVADTVYDIYVDEDEDRLYCITKDSQKYNRLVYTSNGSSWLIACMTNNLGRGRFDRIFKYNGKIYVSIVTAAADYDYYKCTIAVITPSEEESLSPGITTVLTTDTSITGTVFHDGVLYTSRAKGSSSVTRSSALSVDFGSFANGGAFVEYAMVLDSKSAHDEEYTYLLGRRKAYSRYDNCVQTVYQYRRGTKVADINVKVGGVNKYINFLQNIDGTYIAGATDGHIYASKNLSRWASIFYVEALNIVASGADSKNVYWGNAWLINGTLYLTACVNGVYAIYKGGE